LNPGGSKIKNILCKNHKNGEPNGQSLEEGTGRYEKAPYGFCSRDAK
jgi:hypothetical protein